MITDEEFALGPWERHPQSRTADRPPHQEPIPSYPGKIRLWTIRSEPHGVPTHVQDWDGCRAVVMGRVSRKRYPLRG